jgi:hypothetical protein
VRRAWGLWIIGAAAASLYAAFIVRSGFDYAGRRYWSLTDDAMISMRYARNLAHGHGLVWNTGQHVEGYSNFLWTLWMSALHTLPLPDAMASVPVMISGALVLLAATGVAWSIAGLLAPGSRLVPVAAAALVGLCYPLLFWTLRGMETGVAALLVLLAVRLALRYRDDPRERHVRLLALVLAAAVLTRDDLVVPAAAVVAFAAAWAPRERRARAIAILGGAVVATLAAHAAFRLAYYGDALPNTYYLKLAGEPLGARLRRGATGLAFTGATSLYAAVALGLAALVATRRTRRFGGAALLAAVFAGGCLYSLYVGGDYAEDLRLANRFIATAAPALMVLAAVGIGELAGPGRRRAAAVVGALAAVAALAQAADWPSTKVLSFTLPVAHSTTRVAIAIALVAVAVLLWVAPRTWMAALLALLALAAVDYAPGRDWVHANAQDLAPIQAFAEEGVLLHRTSRPGSTVAMDAAGAIAYFSHRPGVDLLGKMDETVAHGAPQSVPFQPGHDKWNLEHSIGGLRPAVVTGLGAAAAAREACRMPAWGYRQVAAGFWVREDARGIDAPRLVTGLRALGLGPPQVASPPCSTTSPTRRSPAG